MPASSLATRLLFRARFYLTRYTGSRDTPRLLPVCNSLLYWIGIITDNKRIGIKNIFRFFFQSFFVQA